MFNVYNLLASGPVQFYSEYKAVSIILIICMAIAALAAIVLILLQPANSTGIDALGGSSETFFGKNKGRTMEAQLVKFTKIAGALFFVLALVTALLVLFGA